MGLTRALPLQALLRAVSPPLVPYTVQAALLREAPPMPNEDADPEPWLQEQGVAGGGEDEAASVTVPTPAAVSGAGEAASGVQRFCDVLRGHVRRLDRLAATTLWFLVAHLRRALSRAPHTRMAARNLAIVFAPGLLRDRAWRQGRRPAHLTPLLPSSIHHTRPAPSAPCRRRSGGHAAARGSAEHPEGDRGHVLPAAPRGSRVRRGVCAHSAAPGAAVLDPAPDGPAVPRYWGIAAAREGCAVSTPTALPPSDVLLRPTNPNLSPRAAGGRFESVGDDADLGLAPAPAAPDRAPGADSGAAASE